MENINNENTKNNSAHNLLMSCCSYSKTLEQKIYDPKTTIEDRVAALKEAALIEKVIQKKLRELKENGEEIPEYLQKILQGEEGEYKIEETNSYLSFN